MFARKATDPPYADPRYLFRVQLAVISMQLLIGRELGGEHLIAANINIRGVEWPEGLGYPC